MLGSTKFKKNWSNFFSLVFSAVAFAQTGIGTRAPVASGILKLNSADKGFKGPNVSLAGRYDKSLFPERGFIVFNTANVVMEEH